MANLELYSAYERISDLEHLLRVIRIRMERRKTLTDEIITEIVSDIGAEIDEVAA